MSVDTWPAVPDQDVPADQLVNNVVKLSEVRHLVLRASHATVMTSGHLGQAPFACCKAVMHPTLTLLCIISAHCTRLRTRWRVNARAFLWQS